MTLNNEALNGRLSSERETVPDIAVVLVCWNNKEYLGPCLRSLYEAGLSHSFEVVVVDNGSSDGSQEMLSRDFPEVIIVQNRGNVGLGRASNQGIQATFGKYILLLNNDTIVNGPSLEKMADFLDENPRGSKLYDTLISACSKL